MQGGVGVGGRGGRRIREREKGREREKEKEEAGRGRGEGGVYGRYVPTVTPKDECDVSLHRGLTEEQGVVSGIRRGRESIVGLQK